MSSSNSDSDSSSSSSSDSEFSVEAEKKDNGGDKEEEVKMLANTIASKRPRPFPVRKGSQVFPSSKTSKVFDSRKKHYRYLHRVGLEKKKQARKKRRKLRETLSRNGAEIDVNQYPTLQSSSSEDSDRQEENSDWERETVDVQAMAHDSWWAKESLFGIMPVSEISSLVGWATHQTQDGTKSDNDTSNAAADVASTVGEGAPGHAADAGESITPIDDITTAQKQKPSPLLGLPNTPLPPSYLRYLSEMARNYVEEPLFQRDEWTPRSFLTTADSLDTKPASKKRKQKDWQQWDYDSDDETYQRLKANHDNLVTLHVPRPAKQTKSDGQEATKPDNGRTHLYESMDTSALVALGMAWEDTITASLLPLARQHVARCRRLEQQKLSETTNAPSPYGMPNRSAEEARMDPFQEWTLPPEQAIWRLAQEGVSSELPSTRPPTRVSNECFDRTSSVIDMLVNRFGNREQREQQAVDNWCHSRNLDPSFVDNNMDLYGVVLPRAPTSPRVSQEETLQDRQRRYDMLYERRSRANILNKKRAEANEKNRATPRSQSDVDLSNEEDGQNEQHVAEGATNEADSEAILTVAV